MSEMKTERKWVIGQTDRFGPSEELTTLIASAWPDNEDYYFLWSSNRAVPQSVVFDTAPQAALAAIEANDQKIYRLQLENKRLQELSRWLALIVMLAVTSLVHLGKLNHN